MTYAERNKKILEPITQLITELQQEHDKYTCSSKIMNNAEWEEYIRAIDNISRKRRGTNLYDIAQYIGQYFLDDTEYVQKELRKIHD